MRRTPDIITNLILVVGLIAIWLAFAPSKLGGQIDYVMVKGVSMEPVFYEGDLVIVRQAPEYQIGDIVSLKDSNMGAFVIHRIIGTQQERFITKGDNNTWIDSFQPTPDEIVGKLWVHLPKMSRVVEWVRSPINLALTTGILGGLYMVNLKKQNPHKKNKTSSGKWSFEYSLYAVGTVAVILLGLTIFSFTRPVRRLGDNIKFEQTGVFSYSAAGTAGVYDTGSVRSGEPVFTKLTCNLNLEFLGFIYTLDNEPLEITSGSQQFYAMVLDEQSGWQRTFPLSAEAAFTGSVYKSITTLDLCQVENLVTSMEAETGVRLSPSYKLIVVSRVAGSGKISDKDFNYNFEPKLTFKFDSLHFYVEANADQKDPMKTIQPGSVNNPNLVTNTIQILGLKIPVLVFRILSILGLLLSLGGLAYLGRYYFQTIKASPEMMIEIKYGAIMIDVYDQRLKELKPVIDVTKIDDLALLAERHNAMIMHLVDDHAHFYLVQIEGTTYRYVTSKSRVVEGD